MANDKSALTKDTLKPDPNRTDQSTANSIPEDRFSGSSTLTSGETPSSFTRIYHPDLSPAAGRKKLRVAAYCRVSTDLDEQKTSFDEQVAAYTDMITSNPDPTGTWLPSMPTRASPGPVRPDAPASAR